MGFNPGSFRSGSFGSGQLVLRRTFSIRTRHAGEIESLSAERDMLAEALRRERAAKAQIAEEVASIKNALSNSKKASDAGDRRIRELRRERDDVYEDCPRLERRLPEIKDGFLFKEMSLASAIRLRVDQTGGIGIDWASDEEDTLVPVHIQNISPYRRIF